MSETIVELAMDNADREVAFVHALDNFARWREQSSGLGWMERDAPDFMVKTVCSPDGSLNKAITFQDQSWASTFMRFWRTELGQGG